MRNPLHLFAAFGIELEYMVVDKTTLQVLPVVDQLFHDEVNNGAISWSNELVAHVLEFKSSEPCSDLNSITEQFQKNIAEVNGKLSKFNAILLGTGMHPLMNPLTETKLWPYGNREIYNKYNEIFNCQGHGWANVQSTHLNLPFANDIELEKLHSAIRLLLPILPALTASSPVVESNRTEYLDNRLFYYGHNQRRIPQIAGQIIPEVIKTRTEYETKILHKTYHKIAPFDPQKILQHEWLNSRGAIVRFDRYSIEIRTSDIQETPSVDVALIKVIIAVLQKLVSNKYCSLAYQERFSTKSLAKFYSAVIKHGGKTIIQDSKYLRAFNYRSKKTITVRELWQFICNDLFTTTLQTDTAAQKIVGVILERGSLAERIIFALDNGISIKQIYQNLAQCLVQNQMFIPSAAK